MDLIKNNEEHHRFSHSHKGAINSILIHIIELLEECKRLALFEGEEEIGEYTQNMSPKQKQIALDGIDHLKSAIEELETKIGIKNFTPKMKVLESMLVTLTFIQVSFDEMKSKNLRGYGEISEENKQFIDQMCSKFDNAIAGLKNDLKKSD